MKTPYELYLLRHKAIIFATTQGHKAKYGLARTTIKINILSGARPWNYYPPWKSEPFQIN